MSLGILSTVLAELNNRTKLKSVLSYLISFAPLTEHNLPNAYSLAALGRRASGRSNAIFASHRVPKTGADLLRNDSPVRNLGLREGFTANKTTNSSNNYSLSFPSKPYLLSSLAG